MAPKFGTRPQSTRSTGSHQVGNRRKTNLAHLPYRVSPATNHAAAIPPLKLRRRQVLDVPSQRLNYVGYRHNENAPDSGPSYKPNGGTHKRY